MRLNSARLCKGALVCSSAVAGSSVIEFGRTTSSMKLTLDRLRLAFIAWCLSKPSRIIGSDVLRTVMPNFSSADTTSGWMPDRELGTEASDESAGAPWSTGGDALALGSSGEAKDVCGCRCMTMGDGAMGVAPLCCCDGTAGLWALSSVVSFQLNLTIFDGGISADAEIEELRAFALRAFALRASESPSAGTYGARHGAVKTNATQLRSLLPSRSSRLNASRSLWPSHLQRALPLSVSQVPAVFATGRCSSWSQCAHAQISIK